MHSFVCTLAALLLAGGSAAEAAPSNTSGSATAALDAATAAAEPAGNTSLPKDALLDVAFVNSSGASAASLRGSVQSAASVEFCAGSDISAGRGFSGNVEAQQQCPRVCGIFNSKCRSGTSYCGCKSCSRCRSNAISAGRGYSGDVEAQRACPLICHGFHSECRRDEQGGSGGCAWFSRSGTSYCHCEVCS